MKKVTIASFHSTLASVGDVLSTPAVTDPRINNKDRGKGRKKKTRDQRAETVRALRTAHRNVKQKCHNPKDPQFHNYGGRGILLAARWLDNRDLFVEEVIAEIGPRPRLGYSLDRIDNNGNYEPGNLRWASPKQQGANRRTSRTVETREGVIPRSEAAAAAGLTANAAAQRDSRRYREDPRVTNFEKIWHDRMKEEFDWFPVPFSNDDKRELYKMITRLPSCTDTPEFISRIVSTWSDFGEAAIYYGGAYNIPARPRLSFLIRNIDIAINFIKEQLDAEEEVERSRLEIEQWAKEAVTRERLRRATEALKLGQQQQFFRVWELQQDMDYLHEVSGEYQEAMNKCVSILNSISGKEFVDFNILREHLGLANK